MICNTEREKVSLLYLVKASGWVSYIPSPPTTCPRTSRRSSGRRLPNGNGTKAVSQSSGFWRRWIVVGAVRGTLWLLRVYIDMLRMVARQTTNYDIQTNCFYVVADVPVNKPSAKVPFPTREGRGSEISHSWEKSGTCVRYAKPRLHHHSQLCWALCLSIPSSHLSPLTSHPEFPPRLRRS